MSTLTQAQPGTAVPARLLSVPLAALCEQLNQAGCTYPGTDLLLRYEVKPHSGPA